MRNNIFNLSSYSFSSSELILLDANIWIYLYPPPTKSQRHYAQIYSTHFRRLKQNNALPVLDPTVLSEYLNKYCKIEYDAKFKQKYTSFKSFRNSNDFQPISQTAALYGKQIHKLSTLHSMQTNQFDIEEAINCFESGQIDFNDSIIVEICKNQGLKLLTNDADFLHCNIDILTTNPRMLNS